MRKLFSNLKSINFWIAAMLIVANLYAWVTVIQATAKPYEVAPIRDQEVVQLLDYIYSSGHSGETWQVTMTNLEAEQTITWYLKRWPQIPFAYPKVTITPDYVTGEGDAFVAGLRIHVKGTAQVTLTPDGLPVVKILDLNLPLPGPIRQAIEDEMQVQLRRAELLPVRFTSAEWGQGVVVVKGYIR
jgi:hypothetical protein